jgi:hypothetical protein
MNTMADRRQHARHPALYRAKYTVGSETYLDSVSNLSSGGIYIRTRRTIEQGQPISLRFPVFAFDQKPGVTGTVVRSQGSGFAVKFDNSIEQRIPKDV